MGTDCTIAVVCFLCFFFFSFVLAPLLLGRIRDTTIIISYTYLHTYTYHLIKQTSEWDLFGSGEGERDRGLVCVTKNDDRLSPRCCCDSGPLGSCRAVGLCGGV
jgi:hypothetical protein